MQFNRLILLSFIKIPHYSCSRVNASWDLIHRIKIWLTHKVLCRLCCATVWHRGSGSVDAAEPCDQPVYSAEHSFTTSAGSLLFLWRLFCSVHKIENVEQRFVTNQRSAVQCHRQGKRPETFTLIDHLHSKHFNWLMSDESIDCRSSRNIVTSESLTSDLYDITCHQNLVRSSSSRSGRLNPVRGVTFTNNQDTFQRLGGFWAFVTRQRSNWILRYLWTTGPPPLLRPDFTALHQVENYRPHWPPQTHTHTHFHN